MSDERFVIKSQDDYWAVIDNHNDDKVCIINGIHTEIEAIWLCDFMNEQQATISALKEENEQLRKENERQNNKIKLLRKKIIELMDDLEKIPLSIREMWFDE